MATLIKKDVQRIFRPTATFTVRIGIDKDTVKNPEVATAHVTIAPGQRSGREYHTNYSQFVYLIKGHVRWFIGPHSEEIDMEAGDFIYIPRGEIHGNMNLSDTEPVEEIACHIGVPSIEHDEGDIQIEHLWKKQS